jgi:predicted GNAT family acetyltransferase
VSLHDLTLRDNAAEHRYEGIIAGEVVGWVEYRRFGTRTVIRHTVVEPCLRGTGIGACLVEAVLEDLLSHHQTLTNYCGFVTGFLETHPRYRSLVDSSHPGLTPPPSGPAPSSLGSQSKNTGNERTPR